MKSTPKFNLSRSKREKHPLSTDSNDSEKDSSLQSSSSGDSVSSSDYSSEEEGYENFQKNFYAVIKESRKLKKNRQAKLKKSKPNGSDLGSSGDSSSSEGKKEIVVKTRKVKKSSVGQKAKSKARSKEERAKEAKQAEKRMKKDKGTRADFIRVDRLWSKNEHRYVLKKSSEYGTLEGEKCPKHKTMSS